MKPRIRRLAVIVGVSAMVGAAGCGAASKTQSTSAANGNAPAAATGSDPDLSALASKLGVSTSALQKAMQAIRPSSGSSSSPQDMAAALAKKLGISEAKVRSAMQSVGPPSGTPPSGGSGSMPAAPSSGATTSSS
jgi:hypothetical protein